MFDLLEGIASSDIVKVIIFLFLAIQGAAVYIGKALTFWQNRVNQAVSETTREQEHLNEIEELKTKLGELSSTQKEIDDIYDEKIQNILTSLNILVSSERDDIKAFITKEHHFFCYKQKWIDNYSLDSIEKRYRHYKDMGGNSYIDSLLEELRALPNEQPHATEKR